MADQGLGKKFEISVREQWKKNFPGAFIYRLPDSMAGFAGAGGSNPCDFFGFVPKGIANNDTGKLFLIECKEHKGMSISFSAIRQYEKLLSYKGMKDIFPGVIVWFSEKDRVIWVSITEMEKMVLDGKKSISLKMLDDKLYNIVEIPSTKKRVFMESDYSVLLNM